MNGEDRPKAASTEDAFNLTTLPAHERHLSAAIESCDHWIETSHDPAVRAAFRLARHELRMLIPDEAGR